VSFQVIAELRTSRYRKSSVEEHTREAQRLQKVLEDACVKLDSVVTDVTASGSQHDEALIAGERDPVLLAEMPSPACARRSELRPPLVDASTTPRFLARMPRSHGQSDEAVAKLDAEVAG